MSFSTPSPSRSLSALSPIPSPSVSLNSLKSVGTHHRILNTIPSSSSSALLPMLSESVSTLSEGSSRTRPHHLIPHHHRRRDRRHRRLNHCQYLFVMVACDLTVIALIPITSSSKSKRSLGSSGNKSLLSRAPSPSVSMSYGSVPRANSRSYLTHPHRCLHPNYPDTIPVKVLAFEIVGKRSSSFSTPSPSMSWSVLSPMPSSSLSRVSESNGMHLTHHQLRHCHHRRRSRLRYRHHRYRLERVQECVIAIKHRHRYLDLIYHRHYRHLSRYSGYRWGGI